MQASVCLFMTLFHDTQIKLVFQIMQVCFHTTFSVTGIQKLNLYISLRNFTLNS